MKKMIGLIALTAGCIHAAETIDLSGTWQHGRTRDSIGQQTIRLPGSMQEQDLGDPVSVDTPWTGGIVDKSWFSSPRYSTYRQPGNVKVPFWLQSKTHYIGEAWCRRDVKIPGAWKGKRIVLSLERPHWETTVWVDDREIGTQNSLSTPHEYDLSEWLKPGKHTLTIRVDNRIKMVNVGPNSHSISDHTQSNWNGIVGKIRLFTTDPIWIEDVQAHPNIQDNKVNTFIRIGHLNRQGLKAKVVARVLDRTGKELGSTTWTTLLGKDQVLEDKLELGPKSELWDEFNPVLHRMHVRVEAGEYADEKEFRFGLRNVGTRDTQITINGRETFLRGTLECSIFPLTGYPSTDVEEWKRIIRICKAHGLNHMRFHSWCPPKAAFEAADELGFFLQAECASWANQGASIGDGKPLDQWLYEEGERILRAYGNHPSFIMMAYGNEPAGKNHRRWLGDWVNHWKEKDPRRIYTSGAGWPAIPENQFHNVPQPRIQHWGAGMRSRINARPPETVSDYRDYVNKNGVPVVSHEIGQWCVYPNFDEIKKYTGVLKPKNFEIFRDFLQEAGLDDQARDFLMASGKLQALCYKEEIESALRTPGFGGFQLLDLHDFPGQGTALVGVLDPFWGSKPYITPEAFNRFCAETVPLARMEKRAWTSDEMFRAAIEVAHFGPEPMRSAIVAWEMKDDRGNRVGAASWKKGVVSGFLNPVGTIEQSLKEVDCPAKVTLRITLQGTPFENSWSFWVYEPAAGIATEKRSRRVRQLDQQTIGQLEAGATFWLAADPRRVNTDVQLGFSSIFWNTAWTRGQAPHTLGILCDPKHPALAQFPTEYHSNWQWWDLVSKASTMELDNLPKKLRPIVQVVPDWFHPKRLGLVFEARVGKGTLLVSSIDLESNLAERPVARQMRASLRSYIDSDAFNPKVELSVDQVRSLFKPLSRLQQLGVKISADSEQEGYESARAVDGDPKTIWHTAWGDAEKPYPHYLDIDLGSAQVLTGITVLPRDDMTNGRIAKYVVEIDGRPVATGTWGNNAKKKKVMFKEPVKGRIVKLVAESEVQGRNWASVAELDVLFK